MVRRLGVAALLSAMTSCVLAGRILCVFPDPSRSHAITYEPLTRALAARGHHVTVISSFTLDAPVDNYTEVALTGGHFGIDRFFEDIYDLRRASLTKVLTCIWQHVHERCEHVLSDVRVRQLVNSTTEQFDLVILEYQLYECFVGFAHRFGAPFIVVYANRGSHSVWDVVGSPSPPSYVPGSVFALSDRMTFTERLANALEPTLRSVGHYLVLLPYFDYLLRKYFRGVAMPHVGDIANNASLLLITTHHALDYPRPAVPAQISVGGIHIRPPRKLPHELQVFLDAAQDGAAYFSLGSTLRGDFIPTSLRDIFLKGFSRLKLRVLCSWDGDVISDLPDNVKVGAWLPQGDILAHPNVRVFMTQGGYLSMQETVFHGVPMVGVPIYGDQFWNVRLAEELGFGLRLELDNVTTESIVWALNTVNDQPSYRQSALTASAMFRDHPQPPLDKAVYWTEYVMRHKGAPHLRVAAQDLAWYQYLMLDVGLVFVVTPLALLVTICALVRGRIAREQET